MIDEPGGDELVAVVAQFIRTELMPRLDGQAAFDARVAANVLDLATREMRLGPAAEREATGRLARLTGREGSLRELNDLLCGRIRDGTLPLDAPGLVEHLRSTTLDKIAIDQPGYASAVQVRETGWDDGDEEPWPDESNHEDRTP